MFGKGAGVNQKENPLKLYYLHGGLHFYEAQGEIVKITRGGYRDKRLLDIITHTYDTGNFPLYVSEGTSAQKLAKIENNKYLMHCYSALKKVSGGLTIYGQSLDRECDQHLIDAIKVSDVTHIAFGIYDIDNADKIMHEINGLFLGTGIEVEYFDSTHFFHSLSELQWLLLIDK